MTTECRYCWEPLFATSFHNNSRCLCVADTHDVCIFRTNQTTCGVCGTPIHSSIYLKLLFGVKEYKANPVNAIGLLSSFLGCLIHILGGDLTLVIVFLSISISSAAYLVYRDKFVLIESISNVSFETWVWFATWPSIIAFSIVCTSPFAIFALDNYLAVWWAIYVWVSYENEWTGYRAFCKVIRRVFRRAEVIGQMD